MTDQNLAPVWTLIDQMAGGDPLRRLVILDALRHALPQQLDQVGAELRGAGLPWSRIGEAIGLSYTGAQRLLDPDIRAAATAARQRRQTSVSRAQPPGVSPAEAARILGVVPRTIYNRIEAGTLETTEWRGRTRILGLDTQPEA